MKTFINSDLKRSFLNIYNDGTAILLESQLADHPSSQKTYMAAQPVRSIRAYGSTIIENDGENEKRYSSDPWKALQNFRKRKKSWLFGYLGYDLKNYTEKLTSDNKAYVQTPDLFFIEPAVLLCVDKSGNVESISGDFAPQGSAEARLDGGRFFGVKSAMTKEQYKRTIHEIKWRITEGDFYEINFSFPMVGRHEGESYRLFEEMKKINPVPFAAYISTRDFSICCSSPERFLKREGNRVVSEPIKGTAARSDDPERDRMLRDILNNEKNRAENLMIVDLVRHDFSRVAKPGSVTVSKLYDIKSFGTVHQLISTIEAEVEPENDSVEVIKACFPMGSMTGAPKIEVMKAIEQLEHYKRGIYSGAIGYFKPNDDFDFNVVIRSAIIQNGTVVYPVGGAITSDSDPDDEWEETSVKAKTITKIVET